MDTNNFTDGAGQPNTPPQTPPTPPSSHPNTGMAMIAYLGILVIIPLLTEAKNDPFVKFHIKQGLVLLICFIFASFLSVIPVIGWLFGSVLWLACLVLVVVGMMNASASKEVELPVIGQFAKNFHF